MDSNDTSPPPSRSRSSSRAPSASPAGDDLDAVLRALRDERTRQTETRALVERAVERRLRAADRARYAADSTPHEAPENGETRREGERSAAHVDPDGALAEATLLACALAEPTVVRPVAREALARSPSLDASTGERARAALSRYAARLASPDAAAVVDTVPPVDGTARPEPSRERALARSAREAVRAWTCEAPLAASAPERHLRLGLDGVAEEDPNAVREAARRLAFETGRDGVATDDADVADGTNDDPAGRAALYAAALHGGASVRGTRVD